MKPAASEPTGSQHRSRADHLILGLLFVVVTLGITGLAVGIARDHRTQESNEPVASRLAATTTSTDTKEIARAHARAACVEYPTAIFGNSTASLDHLIEEAHAAAIADVTSWQRLATAADNAQALTHEREPVDYDAKISHRVDEANAFRRFAAICQQAGFPTSRTSEEP